MKLSQQLTFIAAFALVSQCALASKVNFDQLPAAVQRTANTELKNGPVKDVQSVQQNGRTVYQITYQEPNGANKVIYLDQNGSYVNSQGATTANATSASTVTREIPQSQLPQAVQRTIQTERANGPVSRVEELPNAQGQPMYQVFFQKSGGGEKVIYLNPDGSYVQNGGAAKVATTAPSSIPMPAVGTRSWEQHGTGSSRTPLSNATAVSLNQTPKPVQNALQNVAGNAPLQSVEKGTLNGKTVYEASFQRTGQTVYLRVNPDGSLVRDLQDNRIAMDSALVKPRNLSLNQAPSAVQNAIRAQAGNNGINSIQEGQVNGQTVYQAMINRNGQMETLRVSPNGSIISVANGNGASPLTR